MRRTLLSVTTLVSICVAAPGYATPAAAQEPEVPEYDRATHGTRWLESDGGPTIKMLVEESNLGSGEVEIGEITFPVGSGASGGEHMHGRVEIFYLLSGTFDHVVDGEAHRLTPGMIGIVRPGDNVIHRVIGDEPVRALVIWAPGGEIGRFDSGFRQRPVDGGPGR